MAEARLLGNIRMAGKSLNCLLRVAGGKMRLPTLYVVLVTIVPTWSAFGQAEPVADHHQHLFSPALAALVSPPPPDAGLSPITADILVAHLDAAGIERAVVLSMAYIFGSPDRTVEDEYEQVKTENDWTSQQVARFPDRLRGFCSFNPLRDYALEELARCANDARLRFGIKLHFGNSVVDYHNAAHVEQLRRILHAANDYGMAVVIHMRSSISKNLAYGPDEARIFLNDIISAAPDVPIQIVHLAGAGPYTDPLVDQALGVFVEAIANGDPRTRRLYFDVSTVVSPDLPDERRDLVVTRIRQLGIDRILYGSDAVTDASPRERWAEFHQLSLSETEFQAIASNLAPYMQ
jgi:predicted TIM-barrel fold metal-dependent hydrolase